MLPRPLMANGDLTRLINSDEIQSVVRPAQLPTRHSRQKKNPLKNLGALVKLNPYAIAARRQELKHQEAVATRKAEVAAAKAKGLKVAATPAEASKKAAARKHLATKKLNYERLMAEQEYNLVK